MTITTLTGRLFVVRSKGGLWYRLYHAVCIGSEWIVTFIGHFPADIKGLAQRHSIVKRDFRPKAASIMGELLAIQRMLKAATTVRWRIDEEWQDDRGKIVLRSSGRRVTVQLRRRAGGPWRVANLRGPISALCALRCHGVFAAGADPNEVVEYGAINQCLGPAASPLSEYRFCVLRSAHTLNPRVYCLYRGSRYNHIYFVGYLPPQETCDWKWCGSAAPSFEAVSGDLRKLAEVLDMQVRANPFVAVDDEVRGTMQVSALVWKQHSRIRTPLAVVRCVVRNDLRFLPYGISGPLAALLQMLPYSTEPAAHRELEDLWLYPDLTTHCAAIQPALAACHV